MAASYTLSVGSKIQACASLRSVFEPISVRPLRWALSSSANSNHTMFAPPLLPRSGRDARIFVKSLTGRKIFVTVALEGSAFRLKQLLETTESVPVDDIRLVYSGKQLADDTLCGACMFRVDSCPICRIPTDPEDWNRVYA